MAAEPITLSTTLDSDAPAEEVVVRLRQLPWGPAVRLDQPDSTTLHISSGSKLRYRLPGTSSGSSGVPQSGVRRPPVSEGVSTNA